MLFKVNAKSVTDFPKDWKIWKKKNKNLLQNHVFCFSSLWVLTASKATDDKIRNATLFKTIRKSLIYKKIN